MLAVEAAYGVAIPDKELTPANFRSIDAIGAPVRRVSGGSMISERPLRPRDPELPLDRHARRILDLMAAGSSATNAPPNLEELRRGAAALAGFAAPSPPVERADEVLKGAGAGIAMRRYTPIGLGHAPASCPRLFSRWRLGLRRN